MAPPHPHTHTHSIVPWFLDVSSPVSDRKIVKFSQVSLKFHFSIFRYDFTMRHFGELKNHAILNEERA